MSVQLIDFPRPFQVWLYAVGHGQLLLRSNRSDEFTTRVDMLLNNVAAMHLPTVFDDLSLAEASADEARGLNIQLGALPVGDRKVFLIRGSNFVGYIVAGAVAWHEDEGHDYDESHFQQSFLSVRV